MNEEKSKISEFAIASLVLGIMQFIRVFNFEKALLAIAFGILALRRIRTAQGVSGKNLAVAGIVLGMVGVVVTVWLTIVYWPQLQQLMRQQGGPIPQR